STSWTEVLFKCNGYKEVGIGSRYKCSACDYDLQPPPRHPLAVVPVPPLLPQMLLPVPPAAHRHHLSLLPYDKDASGYVYHCSPHDFGLHPCCAKFPMVLHDGEIS
ncbi:hypothetical protein U1Q18_016202, partial [Sarracenia purpurea var. burkii]